MSRGEAMVLGTLITWFSISRKFYDNVLSIRQRTGTAVDSDCT